MRQSEIIKQGVGLKHLKDFTRGITCHLKQKQKGLYGRDKSVNWCSIHCRADITCLSASLVSGCNTGLGEFSPLASNVAQDRKWPEDFVLKGGFGHLQLFSNLFTYTDTN